MADDYTIDPAVNEVGATPAPRTKSATPGPLAEGALSREAITMIAQKEGADPDLAWAIYSQESGAGADTKTSVNDARGGMQVIPSTYREVMGSDDGMDDPIHNAVAGIRYLAKIGKKVGGDPRLTAAAYFSGPGNVTPEGIRNPNARDGNGKVVTSYADDVVGRIAKNGRAPKVDVNSSDEAPRPAETPAVNSSADKPRPWADVAGDPAFQKLDDAGKAEVRSAYFEQVVAPGIPTSDLAAAKAKFDTESAGPSVLDRVKGAAGEALRVVKGAAGETARSAAEAVKTDSLLKRMVMPGGMVGGTLINRAADATLEALGPRDGVTPQPAGGSVLDQPYKGERPPLSDGELAAWDASSRQGPGNPAVAATRYRMAAPGTIQPTPQFGTGVAALGRTIEGVGPGVRAEGVADMARTFLGNAVRGSAIGGWGGANSTAGGLIEAAGDAVGSDKVSDFGASMSRASNAFSAMAGGKDGDSVTQQAFASVVQNLALLPFGELTVPLMGVQQGAQSYAEAKAAGESPLEALDRGVWQGIAEGVGERFSVPGLQKLAKNIGKYGTEEFGKKFVEIALKEQIGEQITTAMQDAYDKAGVGGLKPNMTLEDYLKDAATTAKVTLMQSALMGLGGAGVNRLAAGRPVEPVRRFDANGDEIIPTPKTPEQALMDAKWGPQPTRERLAMPGMLQRAAAASVDHKAADLAASIPTDANAVLDGDRRDPPPPPGAPEIDIAKHKGSLYRAITAHIAAGGEVSEPEIVRLTGTSPENAREVMLALQERGEMPKPKPIVRMPPPFRVGATIQDQGPASVDVTGQSKERALVDTSLEEPSGTIRVDSAGTARAETKREAGDAERARNVNLAAQARAVNLGNTPDVQKAAVDRTLSEKGALPTRTEAPDKDRFNEPRLSIERIDKFDDLSLRRPSADVKTSADSAFGDGPSEILPGVRRVKLADVELRSEELYETPEQKQRIQALADQIKKNKSIEPLFVARRKDGTQYVAEGAHRARALRLLGYDSVPAKVMVEGAQQQPLLSIDQDAANSGNDVSRETKSEIPQFGTPRKGALSLTGVHYSTQPRTTLTGSSYGTGYKGGERPRLMDARDRRLRSRVYFYVDEGKGVRPESGVGGIAHEVQLNNIYDPATKTVPSGRDSNEFESNVLDAGFDGYYARGAYAVQGGVVVLNPKSGIKVALANPKAQEKAVAAAPTTVKLGLMSNEIRALEANLDAVKAASPDMVLRAGTVTVPAEQKLAFTKALAAAMKVQKRGAAGAFIIARDTGRILLQKRSKSSDAAGTHGMFGGGIDGRETPEQAVRREVREETGRDLDGEVTPLHAQTDGDFTYHSHIAYVDKEFEPALNDESDGHVWADLDSLPSPMHPGITAMLKKAGPAAALKAAQRAVRPLTGAPGPIKVDGREVKFGPFAPARRAAVAYAQAAGIAYTPTGTYAKIDPAFSRRLAQAYEDMKSDPADPLVKEAYDAMIRETLAQWQEIKKTGLKVEFITGDDPYGNPRNAILDVVNNNHLWVYPTESGFGTEGDDTDRANPLLAPTGETISGRPALANDIFRIVHDYFGHIKDGIGFRAEGEENSWQSHAAMYTPLARRAMTSETRGQNSWVNFGPHAEANKTASGADTVYAPQKFGLMPEWASEERRGEPLLSIDRDQTSTPAFKKWFGGSKVVDADGRPLVVYHGTAEDFSAFDKAKRGTVSDTTDSMLAFYFTSSKRRSNQAAMDARYSYDEPSGALVMPVYLSMKNPLVSRAAQGTPTATAKILERAKSAGHDGVIFKRGEMGGSDYAIFEPEQIKSALGNSGAFDASNPDIRLSIDHEIAKTRTKLPDIGGSKSRALARIAKNLTPGEREKLNRGTAERLVDEVRKLPPVDEMAAVAFAGRAKRGWYKGSARAIATVFGADAPRFAALLAAMSPQTSVEINLRNALATWKNWVVAGRPQSKEEILQIMGRSVEGSRGVDSVLGAWVPNTVRALTDPNPMADVLLSGPKVNSFMRNLVGDVNEVTNDAWMANFALVNQTMFSGSLNKTDSGKGPGYLAMSSQVRGAAARLTELTGEQWTPAEVQETIWSWAKTLYELQKDGVTASDILFDEKLTDDLIAATPDFRSLFHDERNAAVIRAAGHGSGLSDLADERASEQEPAARSEASPFDSATQSQHEARAARRLEQLKAQGDGARLSIDQGVGDEAQADNAAAAPVTPEGRAAVAALQDAIARQIPGFVLNHVPAPAAWARGISELARIFGKQVAWVSQPGERLFNGAVAPGHPGVIILDVKTSKPGIAVLMHEMLHQLRVERPDLYAALRKALHGNIRNVAGYAESINEARRAAGLTDLDEDTMLEELIADIVGDRGTESEFWDALNMGGASMTRRVLKAIANFLDHVLAQLKVIRPFGTERYLNDIRAARRAVAKALGDYVEGEQQAGAHEAAGALLSSSPATTPFYSELARQVGNSKQGRATAEQWIASIKAMPGVKQDEVKWTGLAEWLQLQPGKITREQIGEYLAANGVQVRDTMFGGTDGPALWAVNEDLAAPPTAVYATREEAQAHADRLDPRGDDAWVSEATPANLDDMARDVIQANDYLGYVGASSAMSALRTDFAREGGEVIDRYDLSEEDATKLLRWLQGAAAPIESRTQYQDYRTPGGENYRELLLTLPGNSNDARRAVVKRRLTMGREDGVTDDEYKALLAEEKRLDAMPREDYKSGHWRDHPNVLAHVRFDERTDADGKRVLFIQELQSDWQAGVRKARDVISKSVDNDFQGIVDRMKAAGVLEVECD